ncbi:hypothetical protein CRG98_026654 [Punica granatum]|uniref:At1g61320/AtMIF1 LRR domain-containing protein n=1 Tax=Punica granatum TaxID=22663 RepID=A0A2I0J9N4_PUNGR|nr:hypothetical protein CRG98_026654 [Punica granatum]
MERTRESAEKCRGSSPRKKAKVAETREGEQVDRLSSLPDSVLIQILALLPTRDAVKTLMIPSLGRLWDQTFILDFDWCAAHRCSQKLCNDGPFEEQFGRFVAFVDRTVMLHRSPRVFKFRLKINCSADYLQDRNLPRDPEEDEEADNRTQLMELLDSWLESAIQRNVEIFDLDFIACGFPGFFNRYVLPPSVLRSNSLVEMRVASCSLKFYPQSCMKALKCLYLEDIILTDDLIESILSTCPVLETLSLKDCYGFSRVSCESQMLKMVIVSPDILSEWKIEVAGPYITSLSISGWIERMSLGNLPSLHDATIDICNQFCCVPDDYLLVKKVFEKLHHAKVLTVHDLPILVTMIWELLGCQCPSSNWQCLVLKTKLNKWHLPGVANLLRNSPSLETLDLHIFKGELPQTPVRDSWLIWYKFDEDNYWTAKDHSFSCLRTGLKTVKLSGDVMKDTVLQFVQFLLGKSLVLEELIIFIGTKDRSIKDGELKKYKEKVFHFPVASHKAVVRFR